MIKVLIGLVAVILGLLALAVAARFVVWVVEGGRSQCQINTRKH